MDKFKHLIKIISVALVYYLVAQVSLLLAFEETNSSPIWPPTGLAIAAVFLLGYRVWPGIALGAFIANLVTFLGNNVLIKTSMVTSLGISIGNTLEAVTAVYLIREFFKTEYPFNTVKNLFVFVLLAAFTATLISATIGVLNLYFWGIVEQSHILYIWWTWWNGDIIGALVLTPLILIWQKKTYSDWSYKLLPEGFVLFAILILITYFTFTTKAIGSHVIPVHLEYLIIPILLLIAFRFGQRGTTFAIILIIVMAVWFTAQDTGPYSVFSENNALLYLQSFFVVLVITFLTITVVLEERKSARMELKTAHDELEIRIKERTNELINVNEHLRNEVKERKETEIELNKIAATQEVLLREVNHRVQNNLAALISIIHKEEELIEENPERDYITVLEDIIGRVKGLSIVHSLLSTNKWQPLLCSILCEELITDIHKRNKDLPELKLRIQPSEIELDSNLAHQITLVINELGTNTIKHFAVKDSDIVIDVKFLSEKKKITIIYKDNGLGYPQEILDGDIRRVKTGLEIVRGVVEQSLDGEVLFYNDNGAVTQIKFEKE